MVVSFKVLTDWDENLQLGGEQKDGIFSVFPADYIMVEAVFWWFFLESREGRREIVFLRHVTLLSPVVISPSDGSNLLAP